MSFLTSLSIEKDGRGGWKRIRGIGFQKRPTLQGNQKPWIVGTRKTGCFRGEKKGGLDQSEATKDMGKR